MPIAAVQNHYNLSERKYEAVVDYCAKKDIFFVPFFPLQFTKPATEPHDIALLQEVRTRLRSLPETERLSRAQKLAADGDKTARALLTAPSLPDGRR